MKRPRDKKHLKYVASKACLVCGTTNGIQGHHLLRAEPRGMSLKTGDNWVIPLCFNCHNELHRNGDEIGYFKSLGYDYEKIKELASQFWRETHG